MPGYDNLFRSGAGSRSPPFLAGTCPRAEHPTRTLYSYLRELQGGSSSGRAGEAIWSIREIYPYLSDRRRGPQSRAGGNPGTPAHFRRTRYQDAQERECALEGRPRQYHPASTGARSSTSVGTLPSGASSNLNARKGGAASCGVPPAPKVVPSAMRGNTPDGGQIRPRRRGWSGGGKGPKFGGRRGQCV